MKVPEHCLARLRAAGLLVAEPYVPTHLAYPDGVVVAKPASIPGNALPDYEAYRGAAETPIDAPSLVLHADRGRWLVTSHDFVPGPGPGDFSTAWHTPDEAVADILGFYFDDPGRMAVKRRVGESY